MKKGPRIRFFQPVGGLAKIEGSAELGEEGVHLEMAMTQSVEGPVKGVLKRNLPYSGLHDVVYSRRLFRTPVLKFTAERLQTFEAVPGATGFEYSVHPLCTKAECRSFVLEVRLAIAEATMERFTNEIERSLPHEDD